MSTPQSAAAVSPRLALLFLTRGDLHLPEVWEEFLAGSPGSVPMFLHVKHPEQVRSDVLRRCEQVPPLPTGWGGISLVRATLRLLQAALEDRDATHFALVSESCAPVKPLAEILRRLALDGRSRIGWQGAAEMMECHRQRRTAAHHIPVAWWRMQSQWMTLNREAAEWVCCEDLTGRFEQVFAPDEHYFATVLALAGYPLEERVSRTPSTWVRWGTDAPVSWERADARLATELLETPAFFARKFRPGCDLQRWGLHDASCPTPPAAACEPPLPAPRRKRIRMEIDVEHPSWSDTLVCRSDGEFSRLQGTCCGRMEKDGTSRILRWHDWPPERLIRYPPGASGGWKIVPMDWKPTPLEDKAIFVSALGGLGNQLFQLAYAIHLQRKFKVRLLGDLRLLSGMAGVPVEVTGGAPPEGFAVLGQCNDDAARRVLEGPWQPGLMLRGYFQHYGHIEGCRDVMAGLLGAVDREDSLGVHVRRGDYLHSGHDMALPTSYYESGVRRLIAEHPGAFHEIIVFSDDPEWCEGEIVPHLAAILPARVFAGNAIETLLAMKKMRGMILPNSTFGWWGAWFANCPTLFPETWKVPGGEYPPGLGCSRPDWRAHAVPKLACREEATVTIISAFFDLGPFQKGREGVRDAASYRSWITNFGRIVNPLVFYVETEEDFGLVRNLRSRCGLPTRVAMVDRAEMIAFRNLGVVQDSIRSADFALSPPNTTVAEYSCVQHAKYELVAHAIGQGWVATDQCCWMDCGKIFDGLRLDERSFHHLCRFPPAGWGGVHYTRAKDFVPRTIEEIQIGQGGAGEYTVAGGFFIATREVMAAWCERYLAQALHYQTQGRIFTDQAVLHAMLSEGKAPEIVGHGFPDPWFGLCASLVQRVREDAGSPPPTRPPD